MCCRTYSSILSATFLSLLVGCAVVPVYDTKQVTAQFSQAIEKTNAQISQVSMAIADQQQLFDRLGQSKPDVWSKMKLRAMELHNEMSVIDGNLKRIQSRFSRINGEFAAVSYNREKIKKTDSQWDAADRAVHEFESLTTEFNQEMVKLENRHQLLQQLFQKHMAFQKASLAPIEEQFRDPPQKWRTQHSKFVAEFNEDKTHYDAYLGKNSTSSLLVPMGTHLEKMREALEQMKDCISAGDKVLEEFSAHFGGHETVTSLDKDWPLLLKLKERQISLVQEFQISFDQFKRRQAQFKDLESGVGQKPTAD